MQIDETKIKEALEGKVSIDDFDDLHKGAYRLALKNEVDSLSDQRKTVRGEVDAVREERRRIDEQIANRKKELEDLKGTPPQTPPGQTPPAELKDKRFDQFRSEQVSKAKTKLWKELGVETEADKAAIDERFAKLDNGSIDSELIYNDLLAAAVSVNPGKYIAASKQISDMEKNADDEVARQAAGNNSPPSGGDPQKFDAETKRMAQEAGITPEQAKEVQDSGMTRTYN
jgi:hypothetical protein